MILRFRQINRDTWRAIKEGNKKIETRAGSPKYQKLKAGDELVFVCGKQKFSKKAVKVKKFKDIKSLFGFYEYNKINPKAKTVKDAEQEYYSYPKYREKIKKYGLVAIELK